MKTGNDDKISRLEFTVKFIESIKLTEKEDRYTDVKIPGLILAVYPVLVEAQRFPKVAHMFAEKAKMLSLGLPHGFLGGGVFTAQAFTSCKQTFPVVLRERGMI